MIHFTHRCESICLNKHFYVNVYSRFISTGQKLETIQSSINRQMTEQIALYPHKEYLPVCTRRGVNYKYQHQHDYLKTILLTASRQIDTKVYPNGVQSSVCLGPGCLQKGMRKHLGLMFTVLVVWWFHGCMRQVVYFKYRQFIVHYISIKLI